MAKGDSGKDFRIRRNPISFSIKAVVVKSIDCFLLLCSLFKNCMHKEIGGGNLAGFCAILYLLLGDWFCARSLRTYENRWGQLAVKVGWRHNKSRHLHSFYEWQYFHFFIFFFWRRGCLTFYELDSGSKGLGTSLAGVNTFYSRSTYLIPLHPLPRPEL